MLNHNDYKYILKKVIIFFIIGFILSILGTFRVRAFELVESYAVPNFNMPYAVLSNGGIAVNVSGLSAFNGYGKGTLYFNFSLVPLGGTYTKTRDLFEVKALNSNGSSFICDVGTINSYTDNANNTTLFSVKCPVDLSSSKLTNIIFYSTYTNYQDTSAYIYMGDLLTFVTDNTYYNQFSSLISQLQLLVSSNAVVEDKVTYANLLMRDIITNIQWVKDAIENTNDSLDNIDNAINSDSIDNNAVTSNTQGWEQQTTFTPTGTSGGSITDLLTLPIKLIQGFVNGLNSSCVPFSLGTLFDTQLVLPCINISSFIGMPLWTTIDILFSGFMILHIGKKFVKIFNDFTNLKSNQMDDLYGGGN